MRYVNTLYLIHRQTTRPHSFIYHQADKQEVHKKKILLLLIVTHLCGGSAQINTVLYNKS